MKKILTTLICLIAFIPMAFAQQNGSTAPAGSFSPEQVKEIQKIIYDYLVSNPEVLVKASEALQEKQVEQAQKDAMSAIKSYTQQIFNDPNSPTAGNPSGSVNIVEFFDYQCGHCKAMAGSIGEVVKNNPNIKIIFKELPIFEGSSRIAAKAALASVKQNKYYEFHKALFASTTPLDEQTIFNIAQKAGLNVTQLKQDMQMPWVDKQISDNFQLAQELKLVGTPAFIISNKDHSKYRFIPGATTEDDLNKQIAAVSSQSSQ